MNARKLGGMAVLALVVFYAIANPGDAATIVRSIGSGIGAFASALVHGGN